MILNVNALLERRCAMNGKMDETRHFRIPADAPESAAEIIELVYQALKAKGHDPIMQMVG
ncbi:MAG: IreB family regulatory phosphoprotein, partial [Clostridia bacterium]|nr:IreB family regulatory phosphoprotein [Clostridia bacterium]